MPYAHELTGSVVRRVDFIRLKFRQVGNDPEVVVGLTSADREYSFGLPDFYSGTTTYLPGKLGEVSDVRRTAGLESDPMVLNISPYTAEVLSRLELSHKHYAEVLLFIRFVTAEHELIDDAVILRGRYFLSSVQLNLNKNTHTLSLNGENRLIEGRRRNGIIAESAHQQHRYPGDTFAAHVNTMAEKEIVWGGVISNTGGGGFGGGDRGDMRLH